MRICIYAFSTSAYFFRELVEACTKARDLVEWSVIFPQGHFRHLFRRVVSPERQCYLYRDFAERYAACDPTLIARGLAAGEGLITALMKDKDGYLHLDKEEQLRRAATIHGSYEAFLERVRPDFMLFPDLEAVDGFILMNLCTARGIRILYYTDQRLLGRSFFSSDPYERLPNYFGAYDSDDLAAAYNVLSAFRARRSSVSGGSYETRLPPRPQLWRRTIGSAWLRFRYERLHATEETLRMRFTRNFIGIASRFRRWRFETTAARYFDDPSAIPTKYIFYALHYTPESSVNGIEPYYVDQLRVVDALLLNLPLGYRLVVKEHPAIVGLRPLSFYRALRHRPGLVLIHPSVDSRTLVEAAALVTTVTGTVALEAWFSGKPFLTFGRNFFAHLGRRAPALHDLRTVVTELIDTHVPPSEDEKAIEIAKLLHVGGDFIITDPWVIPQTTAPANIAAARHYLWNHIARLRSAE